MCLLGLGTLIEVAINVRKSLPTQETVSLPVPSEARMKKTFIDYLIRDKETRKIVETPKVPETPTVRSPEEAVPPAIATIRKPEPEPGWRDEYSKLTLRQLKAERESLDEKFPETGTRWTAWSIYYLAAAAAAVLGTVLVLVLLRVWCELIIVIFNIAVSLTTIANNTAPSGKSSRG